MILENKLNITNQAELAREEKELLKQSLTNKIDNRDTKENKNV